jgi:uncharacterized protein DUF3168
VNDLAGVQSSIYAALVSAPATYGVYDAVPQLVAKPYIVIGEYTAQPDEEIGTVTTDATLNIHTWSAKNGKAETHAMLEFVRVRLDGQAIAGTWLCVEDFAEIMEDSGSTAASRLYHGIARYRIRVEDGAVLPPLGQFDMEQFA